MPYSLPPDRRAVIIRGLARLLQAGVAPDRALRILADSSAESDRPVLEQLGRRLEGGTTLAPGAVAAGLLNATDGAIAASADRCGNLEQALDRLAAGCERRAALGRQVKARLALPALIIGLAAVIAPLPALVGQHFGVPGYLFRVCAVIAPVALMAIAFFNENLRTHVIARLARLPLAGRWQAIYSQRDYLETLAQALEAGMPALEAIDLATTTMTTASRHGPAGSVRRRVMSGEPLADALRQAQILSADGWALVNAGEQSGALPQVLARQAAALSFRIEAREAEIATWLPRIAYLAAVGAAMAAIFNSPPAYL